MVGRRGGLGGTATHIALALSVIVMSFPVLFMALVSLKTGADTFRYPMTWLPQEPTLANYQNVWSYGNFSRYFLNSVIVALATTLLSVLVAAPAAYGFSRFKYVLGHSLQISFLASQMFPPILFVIPYFVMMRAARLLNSYPALFVAYTSFALPFCTWMLIGYFRTIPTDLDDAAMVDGCGRFMTLTKVILPLAAPGLAATMLFSFLVGWKEFLFALVLTSEEQMYVITVAIAQLVGEVRVAWNDMMAGAMIATLPAVVFYAFLEKYLVEGLTAGAVKG